MSINVNYFKIGIFVLVTVLVLVAGLIVLSSGVLGPKRLTFETYIDESVQGLSVGSAVKERGVPIGQVKQITFVPKVYDVSQVDGGPSKYTQYVIVVMAIEPALFPAVPNDLIPDRINALVNDGLRFRVAQQGITGVCYMEADYFDPQKYPPMKPAWTPRNIYIPSAPSTLATMARSFQAALDSFDRVDLVGVASSLDAAARSLTGALKEAQIAEIRQQLLALISDLRKTNTTLIGLLDKSQAPPGSPGADFATTLDTLNKSFSSLNRAIEDAQVKTVREDIGRLIAEARQTNRQLMQLAQKSTEDLDAANLPAAVATFDKTLQQLNDFVSTQRGDIDDILLNLRQATANLLELSESAKKHPARLFFGGPPPPVETDK